MGVEPSLFLYTMRNGMKLSTTFRACLKNGPRQMQPLFVLGSIFELWSAAGNFEHSLQALVREINPRYR